MSAVFLPSRADPAGDPIATQLRAFASGHGVALPAEITSLDPVWALLTDAGVIHPGLTFAAWTDTLAVGGLLSSILTNSPDLASMLDGLERFHPLLYRDRIILRRRPASVAVTLRAPDGSPAHAETVDASFALLVRTTHRLAGVVPTAVLLRRPAPSSRIAHDAVFGAVSFAQPADSCVFHADVMRTTVAQADPTILTLLRPYAQRRVAHRHESWAYAVGEALTADPATIPRLADVARVLRVSTRTLQQRLAAERQSFTALVESVRRERALALLALPDLSVSTIAARTGFATPAAFTRAFRRWTAMTPTRYRREHASTGTVIV